MLKKCDKMFYVLVFVPGKPFQPRVMKHWLIGPICKLQKIKFCEYGSRLGKKCFIGTNIVSFESLVTITIAVVLGRKLDCFYL